MKRLLLLSAFALSLGLPLAHAACGGGGCGGTGRPGTEGMCGGSCGLPRVHAACRGRCRPYYNCFRDCGDLFISTDIGGYQLDMPRFDFGQLLFGPLNPVGRANIPELAIHAERVTCFFPKLSVGVEVDNGWRPCCVGTQLVFEVGAFYIATDRHSGPGNGTFTNFALPKLDGGGDFLAETAGDFTAFSGVELNRRYRYGGVEITLGGEFLFDPLEQFSLTPFLEVDVDSVQQIYTARIGRLIGGVHARDFHLEEKLNTNYYDFGAGLNASYSLCPDCRTWVIFGEGTVFASCARTHLHAHERATFLPLISHRESRLRATHDAFDVKARGELGVGYQFGYNFMVSAIGIVDYWGYVPRVQNPHRVADFGGIGIYDKPARIQRATALNWGLVMNINVKFF